jgi:hypothetical protein
VYDLRETEDRVHAFVMEQFAKAVTDDVGVRLFTCLASTLGKVFLELLLRSEEMEVEPGEAP